MKIYWSGDSKNIIGAKVRALRLEKKWSQHDLATKVQLLGCECSDLTIRLRSQSPRQGLQRFLRIPIRRLKRSIRERLHYFIRGERQQCRIPQAVCRRATVTRASRSKARLRPVATRRDSWRSHVHRTQFRRPRSSSSYNLPMQNFSRGIERGILSFEREYPPFPFYPCSAIGTAIPHPRVA